MYLGTSAKPLSPSYPYRHTQATPAHGKMAPSIIVKASRSQFTSLQHSIVLFWYVIGSGCVASLPQGETSPQQLQSRLSTVSNGSEDMFFYYYVPLLPDDPRSQGPETRGRSEGHRPFRMARGVHIVHRYRNGATVHRPTMVRPGSHKKPLE